jgi:hypothetical protein
MTAEQLFNALANDPKLHLHYTDGSGVDRILSDGVMRTDEKFALYFTREPMTESEAHNALFIGASTHAGKGSHVIAVRLSDGLPLEQTALYEFRCTQSVRLDQHVLVYAGPNPFRV